MLILKESLIDGVDSLFLRAELLYLMNVLVVGNEFFEEEANVLGYDIIELFYAFGGNLLIILDDPIEMIASDPYLFEDEFYEKLQ